MNEEKDFLEKMAYMDFDPHQQAQRRVWNCLQQQPLSRPFIKPLAWGLCAGVLCKASPAPRRLLFGKMPSAKKQTEAF